MKKTYLSASEILGFPPSKPFNIKDLKRFTYHPIKKYKVFKFSPNKGDLGMNIGQSYILSYAGFAAAGVAAYAFYANGNTNFAAAAAGVSLLCFYGAFATTQNELAAKKQEEDNENFWRETGRIWDRCAELEEMIGNRVKCRDFDDYRRDNGHDVDAIYRHIDSSVTEVSNELQLEMEGIHRRVDAVEESCQSSCETACSGKRGK